MLLRKYFNVVVIATATLSCQEAVAPTTPAAEVHKSKTLANLPQYVDWFSCWSVDYGQTWNCEYTHTEAYSGTDDFWDSSNRFNTTRDCLMEPQYCDPKFRPGGGSPYVAERVTTRAADADNFVTPVPKCPASKASPATTKAYCAGRSPLAVQVARIQAALDRMRQIGGICEQLAAIGDALLARPNAIRVYPQGSYDFGAAAPQGGGATGPNSWMIVSEDYVNKHFDAVHSGWVKNRNSGLWYSFTLQAQLAHELDHLDGRDHKVEEGVENTALTPNTGICSDVDIGPGIQR